MISLLTLVTIVSVLQYGLHLALFNAIDVLILRHTGFKETQLSFVVSCALFGGLIGSLLAPFFTVHKGRLYAAIALNISCLIMLFSTSFYMWIFARIIAGSASGWALAAAPHQFPDGWGVATQVVITMGFMISAIIGWLGSYLKSWRFAVYMASVFAVAFLALAYMVSVEEQHTPDSGGEEESRPIIGHDHDYGIVSDNSSQTFTSIQLLKTPSARKSISLAILVMLIQQLSTVNPLLLFSSRLLSTAPLSLPGPDSALVLQAVMAGFTLISIPTVQKQESSKRLFLISAVACACSVMGLSYGIKTGSALITIPMLVAFILAFSHGLGPLPFMLLGSLLPASQTPALCSIGMIANWTFAYLITALWTPATAWIGKGESGGFLVSALATLGVTALLAVVW